MKMLSLFRSIALVLILLLTTLSFATAEECTLPSQRIQCGALTCNTTTRQCIECSSTDQCWDEALECRSGDGGAMQCLLKPYSMLIDPSEKLGGCIGAIFVTIIVCAIAVIAGVGGGGILTPLFQLLLGLPLTDAVAASQAAIVGQATFNMLLKLRDYHPQYQPPKPTRPVINYTILCLWLPISLVGSMFGNLLGKMVPDWFRLTLLLLFLTFALKRMVSRFLAERKADAVAKEAAAAEAGGDNPAIHDAPVCDGPDTPMSRCAVAARRPTMIRSGTFRSSRRRRRKSLLSPQRPPRPSTLFRSTASSSPSLSRSSSPTSPATAGSIAKRICRASGPSPPPSLSTSSSSSLHSALTSRSSTRRSNSARKTRSASHSRGTTRPQSRSCQ